MLTLCLGTFVAGGVAAAIVPFLPFFAAVISAALVGAMLAAVRGQVGPPILIGAVALVVCSQVGYAIGLAGLSLAYSWRSPKTKADLSDGAPSKVLGSFGADKK